MNNQLFNRILKKPPLLFPWVALFHFIMLVYSIWTFTGFPFPSEYWIGPLWILAFTVTWLFACDLRRWAAYLYLALTSLNIVLRYLLSARTDQALYTHTFFPIDILFCFFILYYFKRFK